MPNFCHFMLSKSKRVSNGLRSVDKEQVFFYPHLIAYFLYKQRKNFCFPQQIVSNLTLSVYRESMAKLEESWLTGKHGKIDPVGTDEIDPVKTA